jgi:hypothetical protein
MYTVRSPLGLRRNVVSSGYVETNRKRERIAAMTHIVRSACSSRKECGHNRRGPQEESKRQGAG